MFGVWQAGNLVPCCSIIPAPGKTDQPGHQTTKSQMSLSKKCQLVVVMFAASLAISLSLSHLADMSLDVLRLGVPHGVVKPCQADPEPIEPIVGSVDCQDGSSGVSLGHSPVPLQHDDLGPDLVIYGLPLVEHLLYVILK